MKKVVIFHSEKIEFDLDADGNTLFVRTRVEFTNSEDKIGVVDVKSWPKDAEDLAILIYLAEQRRMFDKQVSKYAVED